ncbi:nucleotide sugar dehydrogenase [Streptomyces cylindrosporus]|uniref:Nucleotide sugar dehydrogenase n=1 Tax=Streptomyces cylindrosporus TaxID=2927583 RepID=A0ABS9YKA2_9ACTN|nr:nucleotide sugar dehydrogenase [Streptomyces cylindrosporus]MCI3277614.1 nucleotide sugar dehydrogenase [Streptomyces cylindrosporus]
MKIVVMGQGYVGLPLAMAAVEAGHEVVGFEPDEQRLQKLNTSLSYVEDVPDKVLRAARETGRYVPTRGEGMLADFDVAVITVPTPLKERQPDLSYVRAATETLAAHLKAGATVILESTTHPGTTREFVAPILEKLTGWTAGEDFHVGFSPERIDPGNQQWQFTNTPKIVSGLTAACRDRVKDFYAHITQDVVVAEGLEEAELAKVFENTFRHVNIALVNELARMSRLLGVNVWHTLDLAGTKPFGFTKFQPGPGVGGHCLPVDPVYLSHHLRTTYGQAFRLVELAQDINESQPGYVATRLQAALNERGRAVNGSRILALGLAYKADTADMRESPAVEVVELLRDAGAHVVAVDPYAPHDGSDTGVLAEIPAAVDGRLDFDAVVLLTAHTDFDLQRVASQALYVLDTRGVMPVAPHIERL